MNSVPNEPRRLRRFAAEEEYRGGRSHLSSENHSPSDADLQDRVSNKTSSMAPSDIQMESAAPQRGRRRRVVPEDFEQSKLSDENASAISDESNSAHHSHRAESQEEDDYELPDDSFEEELPDDEDLPEDSDLPEDDDKPENASISESEKVESESTDRISRFDLEEYGPLKRGSRTFAVKPLEENEDLKKNEEKKKKRNRVLVGAASGALIVLLTGGGIAYAIYDNERNQIEVPQASHTITEADDVDSSCEPFKKKDLECKAVVKTSDNVQRNDLISQSVKAGEKVDKRKTTINLVYSKGPDSSTMPNVTRMTVDEATKTLEERGLIIDKIETVDSPDVEKDRVVKASIEENAEIKNGQKVTLEVASGSVTLPDWKGKTREEVDASARNLGLTVDYTEEESGQAPGIVISQTPAAKQQSNGDKVTVVLSKQAEAKDVAIPDVVGMTQDQAQTELASAGFRKISTASVENNAVTKPQVTQVIPGVGTNAKTTDQIVIIVSTPAAAKPAG